MFWKCVRAGLLALLVYPAWTSVHAVEVPLPRLELVPWTAVQPDPQPPVPGTPSDEAVREKEAPHRLPFLYDVMPADDDRDDTEAPRADVLDIRGA